MAHIRKGASICEGRVSGGVALMVKSGVKNDGVCCGHLFLWKSTNTTNKMWQLKLVITKLGNKLYRNTGQPIRLLTIYTAT
jgi:hypothetical protein